jgi:hypothetical protein
VRKVKNIVIKIYIQRYLDTLVLPFSPNQSKKVIENTVYSLSEDMIRGRMDALTAKKVPGKKTIVTSAIDLMTRESRLVAKAISTFVSP